ncbi:hypothetical protein, partial [Shewanella sp. CAL98-MNA-CIBAN-0140]|uniref:hypothetical protein n=1 Tax=Shewanella sp. CAL98-MNA-CIBAN-0140 TaxID=3140462 RepID=UPI0033279BEB
RCAEPNEASIEFIILIETVRLKDVRWKNKMKRNFNEKLTCYSISTVQNCSAAQSQHQKKQIPIA